MASCEVAVMVVEQSVKNLDGLRREALRVGGYVGRMRVQVQVRWWLVDLDGGEKSLSRSFLTGLGLFNR